MSSVSKSLAVQPPPPPQPAPPTHSGAAPTSEFIDVFNLPPQERIALIRGGVPARDVGRLAKSMRVVKEVLIASLGIPRATLSRKERAASALSPDESERLLGVKALIGQVQAMVQESGDPAGFDAAHWVAEWLHQPLPALGGLPPASYLDTVEGQKLVATLLAMTQSGAYA
ncbi:antitoxin Xre-like helix-turn-helix domain-containing protein [Rugamonas brunnea]|uniref:antitoxin Xre-like helix-turn-helix domain-containing protein n=1 Tax=Rugamonas brunnea TaxID=2758569 RepID=UPI001E605A43|nr:antitoxin Xre-like helix-turn-helix domain-containing protein [Rugamonas brunnea]